jgi:hypothetical protein
MPLTETIHGCRRAQKSGVERRIKLLGGFSLGLLKPYYLNVLYQPVIKTMKSERSATHLKQQISFWIGLVSMAGRDSFMVLTR